MPQIEILNAPCEGFAGHVSPIVAFKTLSQETPVAMIDVRTRPEWAFVGIPALSDAKLLCVEWQVFPDMNVNAHFVDEVTAAIADRETILMMICRSGARSMAAAKAMTQAGYPSVYNVFGGFEGDLDPENHRGSTNGWKQAGLPWRQN